MGRLFTVAFMLCVWLIVFIGCLRSGALLVDMHDDVAFMAGICAYLLIFPSTVVFVTLVYNQLKKL